MNTPTRLPALPSKIYPQLGTNGFIDEDGRDVPIDTRDEIIRRYNSYSEINRKYNELLYAVEDKYEGETRHDTALRLIKLDHKDLPPQKENNT